jgi:hypothetical protein
MYKFRQVAAAIGVSEASLRNWMTRYELDLSGSRPKGGWRTFIEKDVYVLALAAELVRFGGTVCEAIGAARQRLGLMDATTFEGLPRFMYAAPDGAGWFTADDEGIVAAKTKSPTVVKISVPICLSQARRRLQESAA